MVAITSSEVKSSSRSADVQYERNGVQYPYLQTLCDDVQRAGRLGELRKQACAYITAQSVIVTKQDRCLDILATQRINDLGF